MSQDAAAVQPVIACSQCGKALVQSDLVQIAGSWVCAECKPMFLSRVMASGAASPTALRYGGFWIRFAARIVDGIVVGIPFFVVMLLFMPTLIRNAGQQQPNPLAFAAFGLTFFVIAFSVAACYEILMLKFRAATLGKMACGLKVVRSDGQSLGWGVCVGRYFMWNVVTSAIPYVNLLIMTISSIMVATDAQKRGLHDRVCDTRVIFSRA